MAASHHDATLNNGATPYTTAVDSTASPSCWRIRSALRGRSAHCWLCMVVAECCSLTGICAHDDVGVERPSTAATCTGCVPAAESRRVHNGDDVPVNTSRPPASHPERFAYSIAYTHACVLRIGRRERPVAAVRAPGNASSTDDQILGSDQYYCQTYLDEYYSQHPMDAVDNLIETTTKKVSLEVNQRWTDA